MTVWGEFGFGEATAEDVEAIVALRDAAARWLTARGLDQWSAGEIPSCCIRQQVADHEVFVLRRGATPVGTVTLRWEDLLVWGAEVGPAGYVHNLIVDRSLAGQGLGRRLLQWAEDRVVSSGRTLVRLDCATSNRRLRALYESAGFHHVADKDFPEIAMARTTSLYEKTLSPAEAYGD
ncbi:MAG TPA: GNAT family N-acetyltransferase [Acidimicrobiales bacterium]|nr:GNAT family N-acetyltransferase [Acidimicrobiales bacterium]